MILEVGQWYDDMYGKFRVLYLTKGKCFGVVPDHTEADFGYHTDFTKFYCPSAIVIRQIEVFKDTHVEK